MVLEDPSSCTENSNIVHVPTAIFPTAYLLTVSGVQAKVPALILSEADKATTLLLAARWQVSLLDTPPTDGLAWATNESLLSASIRKYGNVFKSVNSTPDAPSARFDPSTGSGSRAESRDGLTVLRE